MQKADVKIKREEVIKELQELAITEGEPISSKRHRGLYHRACKYIGSWREANMEAGLKINALRSETINNTRKSEILEKLMLIAIINKRVPSQRLLSKYENVPTTYITLEKTFNCKWDELANLLELDLKDKSKYFYMKTSNFISNISKVIDQAHVKLLVNYIFNNIEGKIPFVYVMKRLSINWRWLLILKKNNFIDCNAKEFKCSQKDILNILAFKMVLMSKNLQSIEINNDTLLPDVTTIMHIFNKSIGEVLLMAEKEKKNILSLK